MKDRLLSDEELMDKIAELVEERDQPALVDLFNTQKRLFAKSVIGEDEQKSKPGHTFEEQHRNELRAEQRERIK